MSFKDNICRVAQLCDLVSKPELNGSYVVIESYNAEKVRYGIRTLVAPTCNADSVAMLVKLSNLHILRPDKFASSFPWAVAQKGSSSLSTYSHGTIVDFSNVQWKSTEGSATAERSLEFNESCRLVGVEGASVPGGLPVTKFSERLLLAPVDSSTCMEVLNLDFTIESAFCVRGGHCTFRNCRFGGYIGFFAGDKASSIDVWLENCVFEGNRAFGAIILSRAKVTFLNCSFRNCGIGVHVLDGASATLTHCTFVDCAIGVRTKSGAETLEVLNCSFSAGLVALDIDNARHVSVQGSRVQGSAKRAIAVGGPGRFVVHIEDCVITECAMGIMVNTGKVKLSLLNTVITKQNFFGVSLMMDLRGSVELSGCTFGGNGEQMDVMNYCGPSCAVTIDGQLQRSDDQIPRCSKLEPLRQKVLQWLQECGDDLEAKPSSLKRRRTFKQTGLWHVECANCTIHEPMEVKFKACAKCENVAYCCRECQVAHWMEHKKTCGTVVYI